jgi:hypothetical protein
MRLRWLTLVPLLMVTSVVPGQKSEHCGTLTNVPAAHSAGASVAGAGNELIYGTLLLTNEAEGYLVVSIPGQPQNIGYRLAVKPKLRADKGTRLGKAKKLELADFQPGDPIRIKLRAADRQAVELRLSTGEP